MSASASSPPLPARTPIALYALTVGAFGIGTTEFVIMGLLQQVATDLGVSITAAGLLISGYALGVFVGAPVLTLLSARWPRKAVLVVLMLIFTVGNVACALAPDYMTLMAARVLTSLAHGTFFGVGAVVATSLVAPERRASAISLMFAGLTVATLLGVPAGAWLGLHFGWRATFWAVAGIGVLASVAVALWVPAGVRGATPAPWRQEVAALARPQVLLALLMTVVGFAGVFTVFTYIQPLLVQVTGFSVAAVSPVLLVFGAGMIAGNLLGGRLADRWPQATLLGHARRPGHGAAADARRPAFDGRDGGVRRFARRGRFRHRRATAAEGAGTGGRRRPEPGLELEHRRLQSRQRAGRGPGRVGRGQPYWLARYAVGRRCGEPARPGRGGMERALAATRFDQWRMRANQLRRTAMDYRLLGRSGFKVPALGFGAGTFGGKGPLFSAWGNAGVEQARRMIDLCLAAGVNLFDTADVYSDGASEEILGAALQGRRDEVILSTKTGLRLGEGPNDAGASRWRLLRAVDDSLRRLRTDYIDLLQLHAFDALTPLEEQLDTLDGLVRAGKVRYPRRLQLRRLAADEGSGDQRCTWPVALRCASGLLPRWPGATTSGS